MLTSKFRPHFSRFVKEIREDVGVPLDDDDETASSKEATKILKLYEEQYDMVVHGNLENPSYHLKRYIFIYF